MLGIEFPYLLSHLARPAVPFLFRNEFLGAGDMVQQLQVCIALVEDPDLVSTSQVGQLTTAYDSGSGGI